MKIAQVLITVVILMIAAAASYIIGTTLEPYLGDYGLFIGVIIFLFALRHIMIWHRIKSLLILPDFLLALIIAWITESVLSPSIGLWGIFAGVIVFLTCLAMIAYMRDWEV